MRTVKKLVESQTEIIVLDEKGAGGANHKYEILDKKPPLSETQERGVLTQIYFQNGPIQEFGVNGCQNEDLLAVVIDRLQGFQGGQFACRENAIALTHIQEALMWLERRTLERIARGVEGKNII